MAPNIEIGKSHHEVKILSAGPEIIDAETGKPYLENAIKEALDAGFVLRAFDTTGDGTGSPTCVALLIREVKP
jgi:hypothetical protein